MHRRWRLVLPRVEQSTGLGEGIFVEHDGDGIAFPGKNISGAEGKARGAIVWRFDGVHEKTARQTGGTQRIDQQAQGPVAEQPKLEGTEIQLLRQRQQPPRQPFELELFLQPKTLVRQPPRAQRDGIGFFEGPLTHENVERVPLLRPVGLQRRAPGEEAAHASLSCGTSVCAVPVATVRPPASMMNLASASPVAGDVLTISSRSEAASPT